MLRLLYATTIATVVTGSITYPDELFDRQEIETVMESSSNLIPGGLGLHFNVPSAFNKLVSFSF
jgi:hypothetical protein